MAEIGSLIVFTKKFINAAGADADPALVEFWLREEVDGAELQWTKVGGVGGAVVTPGGMNPIVFVDTGDYSLSFVTRKPERITGFWRGAGTIFDAAVSTVLVRHSLIVAVDP
jgi:hypothetical protein